MDSRNRTILLIAAAVIGLAVAYTLSTEPKRSPAPSEPTTAGATAGAPKTPPPAFLVARPERERVAPPAAYAAGLPRRVEDFQGEWRFPPQDWLSNRICRGAKGAREEFLAVVTQAAAGGASAQQLSETFGKLLDGCYSSTYCRWAAEAASGEAPAPARLALLSTAVHCWDVDLGRAAGLFGRLGGAIREARLAGLTTAFERGVDLLASRDDPRAAAELLSLHAEEKDPEVASRIAFSLERQTSPEAQAVFRAACAKAGQDPRCTPSPELDELRRHRAERWLDLNETVRERYAPAWQLVSEKPERRAEVLAALSSCVDAALGMAPPDNYGAQHCLTELAQLDRPAARLKARSLSGAKAARAGMSELVASLLRFETPDALRARLAGHGLVPAKATEPDPALPPPVTERDVLEREGRLHWFDVETGVFPNEHHRLLEELAELVEPALDGALFEEVAPTLEESERGGASYQLIAYLDGERFRLPAEDLGDWYDVEAVLGLLNALLEARKSPMRLTLLPTGDQTAIVVGGPADGLLAAQAEGLFLPEDANAGRAAGKAFEDAVFEKLRQGELPDPNE